MPASVGTQEVRGQEAFTLTTTSLEQDLDHSCSTKSSRGYKEKHKMETVLAHGNVFI